MMFYYWKPRFEKDGYPGLEENHSHARKDPGKVAKAVEEQVISLYQAHPDYGKKRIEQELAKANHWEPVVSANTVRRILEDKQLWTSGQAGKKRGRQKKTSPPG
jgi:hypothetical protein